MSREDPTGKISVTCFSAKDNFLSSTFLNLAVGLGGRGDLSTYVNAGKSPKHKILPLTHTDPNAAQESLQQLGFTFYKGKFVMVVDWLDEGSAFSFGIIVLDKSIVTQQNADFAQDLNHEYGHAVHASQVGLPVYFVTTAVPSLIGAGLSYVSPWVYENYYSLPWERTADYLGGVDRGNYLSGSNTAATLFWACTQLVGFAWEMTS